MCVYFESPTKKINGYAISRCSLGQGFIYPLEMDYSIMFMTDAKQEITISSTLLKQLPKQNVK